MRSNCCAHRHVHLSPLTSTNAGPCEDVSVAVSRSHQVCPVSEGIANVPVLLASNRGDDHLGQVSHVNGLVQVNQSRSFFHTHSLQGRTCTAPRYHCTHPDITARIHSIQRKLFGTSIHYHSDQRILGRPLDALVRSSGKATKTSRALLVFRTAAGVV